MGYSFGKEKKELPGGCRLKFYQAAVKFARLSRCEMYCNVKIRKGGEKTQSSQAKCRPKMKKRIKIKNSSEKQDGDGWEPKVLEATAGSVSFQSGCQFGRKTQKGFATRQMTMARLRREEE